MGLWIVVDVESDGPAPGPNLYSLVSFGAVIVEPGLQRTFKGLCAPISEKWNPEALAISNISRGTHETYPNPCATFCDFVEWLRPITGGDRPTFISDNLGFDWSFTNWYFHTYLKYNPFGFFRSALERSVRRMEGQREFDARLEAFPQDRTHARSRR